MADEPPAEQAVVVDDDPVIRSILRSTLAGVGLGVHLAADGAAAMGIAARVKADLFLLDLLMPGVNGLETCRHIRSMECYAATPIVVLTGHINERTEEAAFAAGATLFLPKPFRPVVLLQTLAPLLGGDVPGAGTAVARRFDLWGQADPEYRNQLWGRLDARRTAMRLALGTTDLGLD